MEKLGHTPGAEADCKNAQTCTVCNKELAPAKGHTVVIDKAIASTCTTTGLSEGKHCEICGEVLVVQIVIPATGHNHKTVVTKPTCTLAGKTVYTCACGDSYEEVIPATGHSYNKVVTAPTTTSQGYTTYTCVCGDSYVSDYVSKLTSDAMNDTTGKLYVTLQDAINDAAVGDTIILTKNVKNAPTLIVPAGKKLTINMQSRYYAVTKVQQGAALVIAEGAEVVLIGNGTAKLQAEYSARADFDCVVNNGGKLTVSGVNLNGNNLTESAALILNNGDLTLDAGTILNTTKAVKLSNSGTVTKSEDVDLEALEGYHWSTDGKMEVHSYNKTSVPATANEVSYDLYECACGHSYKDNFGNKLVAAYAKIGNTLYASLQEAINAAKENDIVVLTKNVKNATTLFVPADKKLTIDLQGFYYAVTQVQQGAAMVIAEGAEVTLIGNGSSKLQAEYSGRNDFVCVVNNGGKLTVSGVNLNGNNLVESAAVILNTGDLTLNAGTILNTTKAAKLSNSGAVTKADSIELDAPEGYHWTVAGKLEAHNYIKVSVAATPNEVSYDLHKCACGHSYKDNFGTSFAPSAAKIGNTMYATLQDAIDAAGEWDTVVLTRNVKNAPTLIVPTGKKITIDLNGKYYAVSVVTDGAALIIEEGAEVVLTGASKLEAQYAAAKLFDAAIKNNGKLTLTNVIVNANNLLEDDFAIINEGELILNAGVVINLVKASAIGGEGTVVDNTKS